MVDKISKLDAVVAGDDEPIRVATVTFGYKNGELIRKMKERGALIGAGSFNLVPEKDDYLNQIIKDEAEKLKQPVCAFVTFTRQEAYERCEEYLFKLDRAGNYNSTYEPLEIYGEETNI